MNKYELKCIYDIANSFYKKAYFEDFGDLKVLYSYKTKVCEIENGKFYLNTNIDENLLLSNTTLRHIKEFLKQNNVVASDEKITKKWLLANNSIREA